MQTLYSFILMLVAKIYTAVMTINTKMLENMQANGNGLSENAGWTF